MTAKKQTRKVTDVVKEEKVEVAPAAIPMDNLQKQKLAGTALNLHSADRKRQGLAPVYRQEEKVPVSISPTYAPHFGSTAMISVNGISVYIPCDGRSYSINATHAAELHETLGRINAQIQKQNKMASFTGNEESSPGALKF